MITALKKYKIKITNITFKIMLKINRRYNRRDVALLLKKCLFHLIIYYSI